MKLIHLSHTVLINVYRKREIYILFFSNSIPFFRDYLRHIKKSLISIGANEQAISMMNAYDV